MRRFEIQLAGAKQIQLKRWQKTRFGISYAGFFVPAMCNE